MEPQYRYDFSFTASSLRLNDFLIVARAQYDNTEVDYINDLGGGKSSTGKRMLGEFKKRISQLTSAETELLIHGDLITQKHIALISICKTYTFIREFLIEVVREKYLVYDYEISDGDYLRFYRRKFELHEEMRSLTDLTEKKIKQVLFKILEQSGLINDIKHRIIQPQLVDNNLVSVIARDNPNWLKVLLISDIDIERVNV